MKCCGSFSSLIAILAVGAAGVGGFNMIRTGCPLGMCAGEATLTPVSTQVVAEHVEGSGCCALHQPGTVEPMQVAHEGEKSCGSKSSCESKASCETKASCDGTVATSDKAADKSCCQGKGDKATCCGECPTKDAAPAPAAANDAPASEKAPA